MEKSFRLFAAFMFALGIMTSLGIAWNLYQINEHLDGLMNGSSDAYTVMGMYLMIVVFHIGAFAILLRHTILRNTLRALKVSVAGTGLISFFAIAAQKVMFDEIAREGSAGGELMILNVGLIINMFFVIAMLAVLARILEDHDGLAVTPAAKEDIVFAISHALGIVSGCMGILITTSLLMRQVPAEQFWVYLPLYLMILVPYLICSGFWITLKLRTRITDWYDEKQWRDILQSSFVTLILTIPGLALLFTVGKSTGYYWFPYHLSLSMLLFSAGTLYFYKRG